MNPERGKRKPLVTVEYQTEVDVGTGMRERRMFVKMYFDAVDDGLLREMSPRLWRGLCCVARYVDEQGVVRVSQERVADDLGLSREHAHKLLRDLVRFRRPSTGDSVLELVERGGLGGDGKKFRANVYRLHPVAGFQFGRGEGGSSVRPKGHTESSAELQRSVRPNGHRETRLPCDPDGHRVPCDPQGHTYKSVKQENTQNGVCVGLGQEEERRTEGLAEAPKKARELVASFRKAFGHPESRPATKAELEAASALLEANAEDFCQHFVRFAASSAERTKYAPRYFQGILGYVAEAKAEFDRSKRRLAAADAERAAAEAREEAQARAWAARPPEERAREMLETKRKFGVLTRKPLSPEEEERLFAELLAEQIARDEERAPKALKAAAG